MPRAQIATSNPCVRHYSMLMRCLTLSSIQRFPTLTPQSTYCLYIHNLLCIELLIILYHSFFLEVFINTSTEPVEIGTDKLYENPKLWKALHLMTTKEVNTYHRVRTAEMSPSGLTDDQEEFVYDGLLPVLYRVLITHYKPEVYPESEPILKEISTVLWEFCARVIGDLTNKNNLKALYLAMAELKKKVRVPDEVFEQVASKMALKQAGILEESPSEVRLVPNLPSLCISSLGFNISFQ